jgi:hypothetical protein
MADDPAPRNCTVVFAKELRLNNIMAANARAVAVLVILFVISVILMALFAR